MCGPHAWTVALTMVDFEIMKMSFPDVKLPIKFPVTGSANVKNQDYNIHIRTSLRTHDILR